MIKDHHWRIKSISGHHPGLILDEDPGAFPTRVALCSHMGSEGTVSESECDCPCPPFEPGTRIFFKETALLKPAIFNGSDPDVVHLYTLTCEQLRPLLERWVVLYMTAKLTGPRRFTI